MPSSISVARAASGEPCPCASPDRTAAPRALSRASPPGDNCAGKAAEAESLVVRLYRAEAPGLARALRRRAMHADDVLDLVHDAFVRLLSLGPERLQRLAREQPAAYLNRASRNILLDRRKADARRSSALHVPIDQVTLAAPDLEHELQARDELRRLEAAMLALKPKTRAIYMAHRIEGLSYREIAQRCGLSVKGVEKQMSRAIAAVDRALHRD